MARHVLTFFIIFGGMMLAMRACAGKERPPAAVSTERAIVPEETITIPGPREGLAAVFDAEGGLVELRDGDHQVIRPMPSERRPFRLVKKKDRDIRERLDRTKWGHNLVDGGVTFTYTGGPDDAPFTVTKRFTWAADGQGLDVALDIANAGEGVVGLELSAVSGAPMAAPKDGGAAPFVFWRLGDESPRRFSYDELVETQEARRNQWYARFKEDPDTAGAPRVHEREVPPGDLPVTLFGVVGTTHYVAIEKPSDVHALNLEAIWSARALGSTRDVETWMSLRPRAGAYQGAFPLRWCTRDAIAARAPELARALESQSENTYVLEDDRIRLEMSDLGAAVTGMWLKEFVQHVGDESGRDTWIPILRPVRGAKRPLTLSIKKPDVGGDPANLVWRVRQSERALRFDLETAKGWHLTKTVSLPDPGQYDLRVDVSMTRPSDAGTDRVEYRLVGPAGTYVEDAYRGTLASNPPAGLLIERRGGDTEERPLEEIYDEHEPLKHEFPESTHLLRAVAVRGAFFVVALVTEERTDDQGVPKGDVTIAEIDRLELDEDVERDAEDPWRKSLLGSITCAVPLTDGQMERTYRLYAGPNRLGETRPLRIEETVDFGFFGAIGRALMWLMKALEGLVGSYGVAIMLMTLIVRACLMPISYKTQLGMQRYGRKLQKIKPLLDEVEKKHKNNRQKANQERMRIMRENKIGFPLGCLMMFFQIPIWIALFGALRVEFALRHEPFLWAGDLSMPDRLFALPFWPGWFNLLPLLMLVLWVGQQKATPPPAGNDPQVQAQMKMVKFMPYVFFLFLYKYAAALAVYMCVSSAWGILEGRYVRKAIKTQMDD